MPPAFATSSSSIPALSRDPTTTTDENQNISASALALKKLQSVAEGLVDQTAVTSQQPSVATQSHGCCSA